MQEHASALRSENQPEIFLCMACEGKVIFTDRVKLRIVNRKLELQLLLFILYCPLTSNADLFFCKKVCYRKGVKLLSLRFYMTCDDDDDDISTTLYDQFREVFVQLIQYLCCPVL